MNFYYISEAETKFHSYPEHVHPFWEIILICEGSGIERINHIDYQVTNGDIICIAPNCPHESISESGMRDFCAGIGNSEPLTSEKVLIVQDNEHADLYALMKMLLKAVQNRPQNATALIDALTYSIYQLLKVYINEGSSDNHVVSELKSQIMNQITNPTFDLSKAMEDTGFSVGYLRRIFKSATGMPPLNWMNTQRIEFAKRIFCQSPNLYTIKQVGIMVGITDQYYFSKLFKKYEGVSPKEYVQNIKALTIETPDVLRE